MTGLRKPEAREGSIYRNTNLQVYFEVFCAPLDILSIGILMVNWIVDFHRVYSIDQWFSMVICIVDPLMHTT